MILSPSDLSNGPVSPEISYCDSIPEDQLKRAVATSKPDPAKGLTFELKRQILSLEGGKLLLRLRSPILVSLNSETWESEVKAWDVRVPVSQTAQIPQKLSKQFLRLFSKADRDLLSEAEQATWISILGQVDFRQFSIDRAAPHYLEGKLTQRQPGFVRVEWHDGDVEKINFPAASAFSDLDVGEEFSARVKLGLNEKTITAEQITILF